MRSKLNINKIVESLLSQLDDGQVSSVSGASLEEFRIESEEALVPDLDVTVTVSVEVSKVVEVEEESE